MQRDDAENFRWKFLDLKKYSPGAVSRGFSPGSSKMTNPPLFEGVKSDSVRGMGMMV